MPRNTGRTSQNRKVLSFFRVNFGYVPPYYILCDGDIIHQSLKNDMYLKQSLPNILNASAQPATTNCVLEDLRRRGSEFSNAALFAKRITRLPCAHAAKLEVTECLLERLRTASETKIMIAAANVDFLKQLARIPGIPLISIFNKTKLVLRPPNKATLDYVQENEKTKTQTISDADKSILERIKAEEISKRPQRTFIRKKRKAKGPNPLSVKKSSKQFRTRTDGPEFEEGQEKNEVLHDINTSAKLEMNTMPDSASGQNCVFSSGKRKRGRRRSSSKQNGVDEGQTSPPRQAKRRLISVSSSIEGQDIKTSEGNDVASKGNSNASRNSTGSKMNSSNNTPKQGPRKERHVASLVKDDAHVFALNDSKNRDHKVYDERKQDSEERKDICIPLEPFGVGGEPPSAKRKKQRKNRRRRPAKKE